MSLRDFWLIFFSLFLAELGDKTQLAVIGFTTQKSPLLVFFAASFALVLSTFLGVIFGSFVLIRLPLRIVHLIAGLLFLVVGILTFIRGLS
jgi:Ca2+/H+ antiporter, TMEM165/GDT1 family